MLDDFNFGDLKVSLPSYLLTDSIIKVLMLCQVSDSIARKLEYAGKKPSKTFALIKSEMDEKAKRKSKTQSRVGIWWWWSEDWWSMRQSC